jgi:osmotically-inducible protein OsmY
LPSPSVRLTGPLLAIAALAMTPGCVGLYVGVAATGGVLALQERGIRGAAQDTGIRAEINHYWLQRDHEMYMALRLQVWEGRVLVAGALPDENQRAEALALARQAEDLRELIDEIEISPSRELPGFAEDVQLDTAISLRLLLTRDIDSINYSVEAVNGAVYLLGTARDSAELGRVIAVLRDVPGVRRIVNHVLLRDDPRRSRAATAMP